MSLLGSVDPPILIPALRIVRRLKEQGHQALFAGGAVRDLLLGRRVWEIDIATSAPPEDVEKLFGHTIPVGKQYGVVIVVEDSINFEVTTFREEAGYQDGRHPTQVRFTDYQTDALRRDFTINALFMVPETGEVLDCVGGRADLERRLIRTVGIPQQRFEEDKLRVMRAVRLACQLDFEIDPLTYAEVSHFAPKLTQVSWERIRMELMKILTGPAPSRGLQLLFESGILKCILPEVAAMHGVPQPPQFHPEGDVFEHTRLMFEISKERSEMLALGILLHDVGKPPTFSVRERIRFDGHHEVGAQIAEEIGRRLRLSNEQLDDVVDLVRNHLQFINVREMRESTLKRFLRKPNIETHLELHRLDCLASHGDLSNYDFCLQKLHELGEEQMRPQALINGYDLIEMGLTPGPVFSEILHNVEDAQLEGRLLSREDALEWVRANYSRES
ncbi:MAG: CCA tRNA nucleotidyltransferase [Acidobacteria bacterium]|nr:CCA tRNA nucleotidyltransferase [Acidobacteriota bacterium]